MSQTTDVHTLAGAYALDALTEIERAGFARHVASCAACAAEVAELTETAARLGSASSEPPPPSLRERVLAEVAGTRQVTATAAERPAQGEVAVQRWRRWTAAAAAAGVVAIGGMGTVWAVEEGRLDDAHTQVAALQGDQARISAILAEGDVRIRSAAVPGGGTMVVATSPSRNNGVVLMSDLPAPPAGKVYQLWLLRGTAPTSAGVMDEGQRSGSAVLAALGGADTIGVTIEPAGGSAQPSMAPIAGVPLV